MDPELEMQVDELCSLNTENGPNDADLFDIYSWIDSLEFSRPKRNIARDFSDGVLMAELINQYVPKIVDIRNYYKALSKSNKENNWDHLNTKVLSKLGTKIEKQKLQEVINSKPGAIEKVLYDLRPFLARRNRSILNYRRNVGSIPEMQALSREAISINSETGQPNYHNSTTSSISKSRQQNAGGVRSKKSWDLPTEKPQSKKTVLPPGRSSGISKNQNQARSGTRTNTKSVETKVGPQPRLRSESVKRPSRPSSAIRAEGQKSTPKKDDNNNTEKPQDKVNAGPSVKMTSNPESFMVTTEEHALSGNVGKIRENNIEIDSKRPYTPLRIGTYGLV